MTEHQHLEPAESPTGANPAGIQPEFQSAEPRESANGQLPVSGEHGPDTAGGHADRGSEDLGPLFTASTPSRSSSAGTMSRPTSSTIPTMPPDRRANSTTRSLTPSPARCRTASTRSSRGSPTATPNNSGSGCGNTATCSTRSSPSKWPIESQADADDSHRAPNRTGGCGAIRHGQYPQPCRMQNRHHRPGRVAFSYGTGVISGALRAPT